MKTSGSHTQRKEHFELRFIQSVNDDNFTYMYWMHQGAGSPRLAAPLLSIRRTPKRVTPRALLCSAQLSSALEPDPEVAPARLE